MLLSKYKTSNTVLLTPTTQTLPFSQALKRLVTNYITDIYYILPNIFYSLPNNV